jgi:hypothetical protein
MMTREEFATMLNGREYRKEITPAECATAKASGLVVIFGYSDDGAELRGVLYDEWGCFEGGTMLLHRGGLLAPHNDGCGCQFCGYAATAAKCAKVEAVWCGDGATWTYKTELHHATFDIMEDGNTFCRGIVIAIEDLPEI